MLVKICGLTRVDDALVVGEAGADYAGCVIDFPRSPRSVSCEQAQALFEAVGVPGVAVVVNPDLTKLKGIEASTGCRAVQLSGEEPVAWVAESRKSLRGEVWKTVHLAAAVGEEELARTVALVEDYRRAGVDRILVDRSKGSGEDKQYGGTGESPDWGACARLLELTGASVILAGGLTPENVGSALQQVRPYAVDVSSGVEQAPGRKDRAAVRRFVKTVRLAGG